MSGGVGARAPASAAAHAPPPCCAHAHGSPATQPPLSGHSAPARGRCEDVLGGVPLKNPWCWSPQPSLLALQTRCQRRPHYPQGRRTQELAAAADAAAPSPLLCARGRRADGDALWTRPLFVGGRQATQRYLTCLVFFLKRAMSWPPPRQAGSHSCHAAGRGAGANAAAQWLCEVWALQAHSVPLHPVSGTPCLSHGEPQF